MKKINTDEYTYPDGSPIIIWYNRGIWRGVDGYGNGALFAPNAKKKAELANLTIDPYGSRIMVPPEEEVEPAFFVTEANTLARNIYEMFEAAKRDASGVGE